MMSSGGGGGESEQVSSGTYTFACCTHKIFSFPLQIDEPSETRFQSVAGNRAMRVDTKLSPQTLIQPTFVVSNWLTWTSRSATNRIAKPTPRRTRYVFLNTICLPLWRVTFLFYAVWRRDRSRNLEKNQFHPLCMGHMILDLSWLGHSSFLERLTTHK